MSISKAELLHTLERYTGHIEGILQGSISLPVAGASTLGGVKIGEGLEMNGDTLSVTLTGGGGGGGGAVLDTVPSTVAGAMWLTI